MINQKPFADISRPFDFPSELKVMLIVSPNKMTAIQSFFCERKNMTNMSGGCS